MNHEFDLRKIVTALAEGDETRSVGTANPSEEHMRAVMHSYIDNLNKFDPEFFSKTFSEDYTYQDPFGAGTLDAKDMAERFDTTFFTLNGAELLSPISTSFGNSAAMSFRVFAEVDGRGITIDIVDVMTFNDAGKIADVKAYWGVENISLIA